VVVKAGGQWVWGFAMLSRWILLPFSGRKVGQGPKAKWWWNCGLWDRCEMVEAAKSRVSGVQKVHVR